MSRFVCLLSLTASAAVPGWCGYLYSSGTPAQPLEGPEITVHEVAGAFQLGLGATVSGFEFWSFEYAAPFGGFAGSISWNLYRDDNGPGTSLYIGNVTDFQRENNGTFTVVGNQATLFRNIITVNPFGLDAGSYWLGLTNGDGSLNVFNGFFWAESAGEVETKSFTEARSANWNYSGLNLAFRLDGQDISPPVITPQPATAILFGVGAFALAALERRRTR
ncbi:MAG: hypothetical protein IT168_05060 [Bryobacterales bacterium]|nr:hypothetical protein [Bryobacterales bacterium]